MNASEVLTSDRYPQLFSGIKIGGLSFKNRIMHAAITTGMVTDGRIPQELLNYYLNRAMGGAAAIVIQPSNVHAEQLDKRRPDVFDQRYKDSLKQLTESVGKYDCHMLAQLQDSGRGVRETGRNDAAQGVSPCPDGISWTVPRPLSVDAVQRMIEQMAFSAGLLKQAGFAGVELSAGHGHLLHQFLSPWSNRREDQYGGDVTGRTRFVRELIQAVRADVGKGFIIGIKMPASDGVASSIDKAEAQRIAAQIASTREIDYWTFCKGNHADSLFQHLPDAFGKPRPYLGEIESLRQVNTEIPTAALGYINSAADAEATLSEGRTDLVMLGRPIIADPAWPEKSRTGRESEIRKCLSCNACWKSVIADGRLACVTNPRIGQAVESPWLPTPVEDKKTLLVIGAGVAGLETAWVAAARGHRVTVVSSSNNLGGKLRAHARLPGGENLSNLYAYQHTRAEALGVQFEFGVEADVKYVMAQGADIVVLATGSSMSVPNFLPEDHQGSTRICSLRELVGDPELSVSRQPGSMLVYDHDHTEMTYAAALHFADLFDQVVIVTPRERLASDVSLMDRQGIYSRLHQKRIQIIPSSVPVFESGTDLSGVQLQNIFNGDRLALEDISQFVYSTTRISNDDLYSPLLAQGVDVRLVGDSVSPRSPMVATREGHALGNGL